ncbi:MAG: protein-glutamate methylesterase/protein-glutamine glutaminase [Syntrophomonadaceae bacterium]
MAIKVLVVDDSAFIRQLIISVLQRDPNIQVVDYARDGLDALAKIERLQPDVVTLDIEMPKMDGMDTLKEIMTRFPRPVLMLSSLTTAGAQQTLQALEMGAVDFIPKPLAAEGYDSFSRDLIRKVKTAKRAVLKTDTAKRLSSGFNQPIMTRNPVHIIGIGSSTGGPSALQTVLTAIPTHIPVGIVIAQHMPEGFTKPFAARLDNLCQIRVKEAADGDIIEPGAAYIAPAGRQMQFKRQKAGVSICIGDDSPIPTLYKPSVDVMFLSMAEVFGGCCLAVILTGMGNDGTRGAKKLKELDAVILSQDQESCVIYGMPKSVAEAGIVDRVVNIKDMGNVISRTALM